MISIAGWGNRPVQSYRTYRPQRWSDIQELVRGGEPGTFIARGLGRSYGDASLNKGRGIMLTSGSTGSSTSTNGPGPSGVRGGGAARA